ncbi:MAG: DUF1080 domain-containing protein [Planctomycetota bacterium]
MKRLLLAAIPAFALSLGLGTTHLLAEQQATHQDAAAANSLSEQEREAGWTLMFNGRDLGGWKMSDENPESVRVEEGMLITHGRRGHIYFGEDGTGELTEFELKADVYCKGPSNSGIYILTAYQPRGWPGKGFECQVANGYGDPRKTASIYAIDDIAESPAKDNAWFHYHIRVQDGTITIWINGDLANEWTQPEDWNNNNRNLNNPGTIALQAHDPGSEVRFKNLKLRVIDE